MLLVSSTVLLTGCGVAIATGSVPNVVVTCVGLL